MQFTLANSTHPNHTVQTRELHRYLRWCNANARHPNVLAARWVKNDRLNHAGYLWAFSAITASPGAKAHYRRRRDNHAAAQRNLFNRMTGQLYHCLQQDERFDEALAFPSPPDEVGTAAA